MARDVEYGVRYCDPRGRVITMACEDRPDAVEMVEHLCGRGADNVTIVSRTWTPEAGTGSGAPVSKTPAWASVEPNACITVACSACGAYEDPDETGGRIHYATIEAARRDLLGQDGTGWVEDGDVIYCRACVARHACDAAGGHDIRTITHPARPGLAWYCAREGCPSTGMVRVDTGSGGPVGR